MTPRISAVTMPKWGMTMTEGKVVRWRAKPGEALAAGTELVEIETSKIANVLAYPGTGVLRRVLIDEGITAPIGAMLAVVALGEVPDTEIDAFIAGHSVRAEDSSADTPETGGARLIRAGVHTLNVLSMGAGSATPVLFVHGFGGDLNSWMFNQAVLSQDRPTHALDLPGHGQSSPTYGKGSVRALSEVVIAALDALNIRRAHLVGHSMGGAIALLLAATKPEQVASVTGVAPGGLGPELNRNFIDGFIAANSRKQMQEALGLLFVRPDAVSRQMIEEALQYKRQDGTVEALAAIAAANFTPGGQKSGLRELLPSLKVPVQMVWGRNDRIIPVAQAEGLGPNVAVTLIEGAGHMPHMEEAATVNRLIADFIARHD